MKIPKVLKRLCKFCKKHTEQKVRQNKKKTARSMSKGSKYRAKGRGVARGIGSMGRYSKPAATKWKRSGAKNTKKSDLRYTCQECKKSTCQPTGIRAKKIELV